jgi:predicted nucleotidyltransferase
MAEESIIVIVKNYLKELSRKGVPVKRAVLFGSYANETDHKWSDIDVIVISDKYDETYSREDINVLWRTAARTDNRIEPIPVGSNRWETDDESTIIEIARREGIVITL